MPMTEVLRRIERIQTDYESRLQERCPPVTDVDDEQLQAAYNAAKRRQEH